MSAKTLVLGASTNPDRYAYLAIQQLRKNNIAVVAIGQMPGVVADVPIHATTEDFDDIDTVTLYLNPERQKAYYDYILSLHPRRVIFNPGTENPEFYQILSESQISSEVACTLVLLSTRQF